MLAEISVSLAQFCSRGLLMAAASIVWLSKIGAHTHQFREPAAPIVLLGIGHQGVRFAPLTNVQSNHTREELIWNSAFT
jgi:hypothetical protein